MSDHYQSMPNEEFRKKIRDSIDSDLRQQLGLLVGEGTELTPYDTGMLIKFIKSREAKLIREAEVAARIDERRQMYYVAHDILADSKIPRKEALKYFDERLAQLHSQQREGEDNG